MTHPLEPSDVGPIAGGHLRVGDSDRHEALSLLQQARQDGRIGATEHDRRIALVEQAQIFDDLFPVTRDLKGPRPSLLGDGATASRTQFELERRQHGMMTTHGLTGHDAADTTHIALFSGYNRKPDVVPEKTSSFIMFGGGDLDLRDAHFVNNVCTINVFCAFGGLDVVVPRHIKVINKTVPIFGGTSVKKMETITSADVPTLVITGVVAFGGVDVRGA